MLKIKECVVHVGLSLQWLQSKELMQLKPKNYSYFLSSSSLIAQNLKVIRVVTEAGWTKLSNTPLKMQLRQKKLTHIELTMEIANFQLKKEKLLYLHLLTLLLMIQNNLRLQYQRDQYQWLSKLINMFSKLTQVVS